MGHVRATPCVCHAVARCIACHLCRRRARGAARSAARPALGSLAWEGSHGPLVQFLAPRTRVALCVCTSAGAQEE
eukprot:15444391-Alexandrium_andersonii.AAC.1